MSRKKYARALYEAHAEAMRMNADVFLLGEDVEFGPFEVTRGLVEEFGRNRVRNTPISEAALAGIAVGAAMTGMRPILEIQFADILAVSFDHIVNSAAKMRYLASGKVSCPVVIRAPMGVGLGMGMHHSQCVESWFANVPGLIIVCPSTPYDAKGLLHAAVEAGDPVVFLEHKRLYGMAGEVPDGYYTIPLGKGEVKRQGSAATIVATSSMVSVALNAAESLAAEGIEVEVIDPRTIKPLDEQIIVDSVKKTGRAIVLHEAPKFGGIGAEISAVINEKAADYLLSPVVRLAGREIPVPFAIEDVVAPKDKQVMEAVKKLLE